MAQSLVFVHNFIFLAPLFVVLAIHYEDNLSLENIFIFPSHAKLLNKSEIVNEFKRIAYLSVPVLAALWYCFSICAKVPKGIKRLISLAPVFCLFTFLPLYLTTAFFTISFTMVFTWVANFKLVLFAFDQGPLAFAPSKTLPVLAVITALPITLKTMSKHLDERKSKKFSSHIGFSILLLPLYIGIIRQCKQPLILQAGYSCAIFHMVDIIVGFFSFMVQVTMRLELVSPSHEPYLSTSIREFWGWRWNPAVSSTLRQTVLKPVRSAASTLVGNELSLLLATLATFLVSGLMHELVFCYVTRASPTWELAMYLVLQGVCVVVEFGLEVAMKKKLTLPCFIRGPLTMGFLVATSSWLLYPPFVRNGVDVRLIQELSFFWELIKDNLVQLLFPLIGISI